MENKIFLWFKNFDMENKIFLWFKNFDMENRKFFSDQKKKKILYENKKVFSVKKIIIFVQ